MTLQQAEMELSKIDDQMAELLKQREKILKEWNIAFNSENTENITCVDENIYDVHILKLMVLVNNSVGFCVLGMLRYQICCICKLYQHTF